MLRYLALATVLVACAAFAQSPQHTVREDAPRVGSNIRRDLTGPVSIPINLPYESLSQSDRRKFHQNYEAIADGDEPPFPKGGLQAILKPITQGQQRLLVEGDLFLVATVLADGSVKEVTARGSPSEQMTNFAAQVLLLTPFKPALCSGKPCVMEFPLRMNFSVN